MRDPRTLQELGTERTECTEDSNHRFNGVKVPTKENRPSLFPNPLVLIPKVEV